jgi:KipI family sensor histidine kinase inhibitor
LLQGAYAMNPTSIEPLGDRAFLAQFPDEAAAGGWAVMVRDSRWPGVTDVVLAYHTVAVFADPDRVDLPDLESRLRAVAAPREPRRTGGRIVIPVLYAGEDLNEVAARCTLSPLEVVNLHCSVEYQVFAIGFQPGFPYAGDLPPALAGLPRRDSPRTRVPAGSVAIAGRQTGIYPRESPGGWHLIGITPLCIAQPDTGYFPIRAGDLIAFQPIGVDEFRARRDERL